MKTRTGRFAAVFLAAAVLTLCAAFVPMLSPDASAFVVYAESSEDFDIGEDGTLNYYNGSDTTVTIPDGVTAIGDSAFEGNGAIETVVVPQGVTSIGTCAFRECGSLKNITLPDSVTEIGSYAFCNCDNLKNITLPSQLTTLGSGCFVESGLTEITIPKTVTSSFGYDDDAPFRGSALKKAVFEDGTTEIGSYLLYGCNQLTSVEIPDTVVSVGDYLFARCTSLRTVEFPVSVTFMGSNMFSNDTSLRTVTLPTQITELPAYTFEGCSALASVNIPAKVTQIGYEAFYGCTSLSSVTIPNKVGTIAPEAFYGCTSLASVTVPESVRGINSSVFARCTSLTEVNLADSISYIGNNVFEGCTALRTVTLPSAIERVDNYLFSNCTSLETIEIPANVRSIGYAAFRLCPNLTTVTLNRGLRYIEGYAFSECTSLTEINIPNGVETIENNAFEKNTKLAKAVIPATVTQIQENAFSYPTRMTIYGYANTYAQQYAEEEGFTFVALEGSSIEITTQPEDVTVGKYEDVYPVVNALGFDLTYQWYYRDSENDEWTAYSGYDANSQGLSLYTSWDTPARQIYCLITSADGSQLASRVATITVDAPVEVTSYPESSVYVREGSSVTLTVEATGRDLTYEWRAADEDGNWRTLDNNTSSLTVAYDEVAQYGCVECNVRDKYGNTHYGDTIYLYQAANPTITEQPEDIYKLEGNWTYLSVQADGYDLHYQWYRQLAGRDEWEAVDDNSEGENEYGFYAESELDGARFFCRVTDGFGETVDSDVVTLTIDEPLNVISYPTSQINVREDGRVTLTVEATGRDLTYEWHASDEDGNWRIVENSNMPSLTVSYDELSQFSCVYCYVYDSHGYGSSGSYIYLYPAPTLTITGQPEDVTNVNGNYVSFRVKAEGVDVTYQWYRKAADAEDWEKWEGYTDEYCSIYGAEKWDGMSFRCVLTDRYGDTVTSDPATFTLDESIEIVEYPSGGSYKVGDTATISVVATGRDLTYQWYCCEDGTTEWTEMAGLTTSSISLTVDESYDGMRFQCRIHDKYGNGYWVSTTVYIKGAPRITRDLPQTITLRNGRWTDLSIGVSDEDLTYQWFYKKNGQTEWTAFEDSDSSYLSQRVDETWDGMQIYCTVADEDGESVDSTVMTVSVIEAARITEDPDSVEAYVGDTVEFHVKALGEGLSYEWRYSLKDDDDYTSMGLVSDSDLSLTVDETWDGAWVYCRVKDKYDNYAYSDSARVTVVEAPDPIVILTQPEDVTVRTGEQFELAVEAEGSGLTYQWSRFEGRYYYSDYEGGYEEYEGEFVPIEGATAATFSTLADASYDGARIRCTVSDDQGNTLNTSIAYIIVKEKLAVVTQPTDVTVMEGDEFTLAVAAKGSGLGYQWYYQRPNAKAWYRWSGHYDAETKGVATVNWNGVKFYCMVNDRYNNKVKSETCMVNVKGQNSPVEILTQPADVTVAAGETVSFTVKALGSNLSYQWYYKKAGVQTWSKWNAHTTATTTAIANATWNGMQVYCVVTDGTGASASSEPATITVGERLEITAQPENVTVKAGVDVSFTVAAKGSGLTYQWYYKKAGTDEWKKWNSRTTATTTATANATWDGMQVYCAVTDNTGATVNSEAATISLVQFAITAQPQDVTAKAGETVSFKVFAVGTGLNYQWYFKKANATEWKLWNGHNTAVTSAPANATWNGMQVYCVITDSTGETISSDPATITITSDFAITEQPANITVKAGETATFKIVAEGSNLKYQWYIKKEGATEWKKWNGHDTAETTAPANATWNNMSFYCEVTDEFGNTLNSREGWITIEEESFAIVGQPEDVAVKAGESVSFTVKATGDNLKYQWYYKKAGATVWNKWNGRTTATTTATANATWNGMQVYCVVTDGSGTNLSSDAATITLVEELAITAQPEDVTVKAGDNVSFTVKATGNDLKYQWYIKKVGAADWKAWNGHTTATTSAASNATWDGMQIYCIVTDGSGKTVSSNAATITIA